MIPQAGAIAVRKTGPHHEFLLVTAKKEPDAWIFPKGHVERGETLAVAAVRELQEEAGVEGDTIGPVGTLRFMSGQEQVEVTYFLIVATHSGPAHEGRQLLWLPHKAARARLSHKDARGLLDRARALLEEP